MKSLYNIIDHYLDSGSFDSFRSEYNRLNTESEIPFFASWELCIYIVSKSGLCTLDYLTFILRNNRCHIEIINYKQYYLFREICKKCNDLALIRSLHTQYYIPLSCKYHGCFLSSCVQGNKDIIMYFIENKSADWSVKYYKPVKLLLIYLHLDTLIELMRQKIIDRTMTYFDNYFVFRHICMLGKYTHLLDYLRIIIENDFAEAQLFSYTNESEYLCNRINETIDITIDDHYALEKSCKNGHYEVVTLLARLYERRILCYLVKRKNYCLVRTAAISGNLELLNYLISFIEQDYAESSWNNTIFFRQLCKNAIMNGNLAIIREIISRYMKESYDFEMNIKNVIQIKCPEEEQIRILDYFNEMRPLSQEFLIDSFYSSLDHNRVQTAEKCRQMLHEDNVIYLIDEYNIGRIQGKFSVETREYIYETFPEIRNIIKLYEREYFFILFAQNQFAEALKIFKEEYLTNAGLLIQYGCLNNNYEMVRWVFEKCKPTNFIVFESFSKVCENGNLDIMDLIIDHIYMSDVPKGFRIACIHNRVFVMDYLYNKFAALIELDNILVQVVYLLIQIENMETFYWFHKKINLHNFFNQNFNSYRIYNIIEGICAGNSYELFRFIIQFINMNYGILFNVIKWSSKFNRDNILLYAIDIFRLYDIDPNYLFKSAILSKNYFIVNTDFYRKHRFSAETIRICVDKLVTFNNVHVFDAVFCDYMEHYDNQLQNNMVDLFYHAYEKESDQIAVLIFGKLTRFAQYQILAQVSNDTFSQNIYLLELIYRKHESYSELLLFDHSQNKFIFIDVIKRLYQEKTKDSYIDIMRYFGIEYSDRSPDALAPAACFICCENESVVCTNCRHYYCEECFVEFVYKYENFYCGMCRQKLNFSKCYLIK
jgi:hypothetical protein